MLAAALLFCFLLIGTLGHQSVLQLISFDKRHLFVNKGSGFQLSCPYIGNENNQVKIQWFKNDLPISPLPGVSVLSLKNASKYDAGSYYCKVSDDYAAVLSEATQVHVAYFTQPFVDTSFHVRTAEDSYAVLNAPSIDASPLDKLQWTWTHNGQLVHQSPRTFLSTTGSLILVNVRKEDFGQYTLYVKHTSLPESSAKFNYLLEPGETADATDRKIVWKPKTVVFVKSDWAQSVRFECVVFDRQPSRSHIVWKVNGQQIFENRPEYQLRNLRRTLFIQQPNDVLAGQYQCEVSNGFYEGDKATASLIFNEPPVIVHSLPNVTYATLGGTLELFCEFQAIPEARITWYFNGDDLTEPLKCCADNLSMAVIPDSGLRILKVSKEHTGIYQCRAQNEHGSVIDTTELRLRDLQPSVNVGQNISVVAGNNVTLPCHSVGSPKPVVNWFFAGRPLEYGNDVTLVENNLVITNAKGEHTGWYTCVASNDLEKSQVNIFLTVEESAGFIEGPEDQAVIIGTPVTIPCRINFAGDADQVTRRWYLKQQLLLPGAVRNIQFLPNGAILISHVNPINIGPYTCEVRTPSGVFSKTGYLKIIEKPGMPLHVKARLNNDTMPITVTVTWREGFDGNSPIVKYVLEHRVINLDGTPSEWEVAVDNVGREQASTDVENLKPSAMYEFRVIAVNRLGYGIPSVSSNRLMMPQQAPAAAPVSVAGSARSASDIMIQWQPPPPEQWNGDILGYLIRYRLANYPEIPWMYHNLSDPRARNWMISDLITWREYEIQMAAFNDRGAGVYSKSMYITTLEGIPTEAPVILTASVLNSTAVHVKMKPPPQQLIPGVNLGYKIEAWLGEPGIHQAAVARVLPYDLNVVEGTLGNLQKYVTYNVTVLCFTGPGDGPRSQPVELTTKQDVPERVDGAIVEEAYFDSAILKWKQPIHPNGILLNYVVSYWSLNDSSINSTVKVPNNTLSFRLEGLKPKSSYAVVIYAVTEVGNGPPTRLQVVTTVPPELPGAPSRLTVSNIQQRSATLQFTPGYDGKTFISKWIVQALVGSSSAWQEVYAVHAPQAKAITLDTLRPFLNYTLRLVAENVVGRSPPSAPAAPFQTLQDVPEHPPTDFDAQPSSADAIRVTWNPLSRNAWNGPGGGYVLFVLPEHQSSQEQQVKIENPKASELPLTDLCAFCSYRLSMAAFNEIGQSNRSEELLVITYESEPSMGPSDVSVSVESPTSALISWGEVPTMHRNGRITGYRLEYQSVDPPTDFGYLMVDDESQRSALFETLKAYTKYRVRVAAVNAVGVGSYSHPDIVFQTPTALSHPPTELYFPYVTNREVRMTWKPPLVPNGEIKQYAVAYWLNSTGPEGAVKVHPNFDLRLFVASGLFPMSTYTFSVAAVNAAGTGLPAVATVYTTTDRSQPQSPTRPMQAPDSMPSHDKIIIIWNNVYNSKAPIRFNELQIQHENSDDWLDWPQKPTESRAVVDKLRPNTAYRFRVRSFNDHGQSPWSIESDWIRTTEAEPDEPPVDIKVKVVDTSSVFVEWNAPDRSSWHSDVVGYRILSRIYQPNETYRIDELPMTDAFKRHWNITLTNLERFKHYVIQLQTFNNNGSSPKSRPQFVYVGYSVLQQGVNNLRAEPISSTEVKVTWDRWDGPPLNGFKVLFIRDDENASEEDVVDADSSSNVLTGLKKYANYSINVRPFNRAGDGPPSMASVQTLPDRPGPISRLLFQDILLDSVNVSWSPPSETNGPIIGYRVTYRTYKLDKEFMSQRQEKVIGRQYLLVTNLEENVTVSFTVEAETVVGYGQSVNGSVVLGPQVGSPEPPGRPSLHPSDSSVTLQWSHTGNTSVMSYIIQYCMQGLNRFHRSLLSSDAVLGNRWHTLASVDALQTKYTIAYKQLKPGRLYRFRVAGRNQYGVSYPSQPSEQFVLPEGFQDKPFYLEGWFLVILAMILLVIVVIVVATLWVTGSGKKQKPRSDSDSSLQLSDGGIVTYQLRSSSAKPGSMPPYGDDHYSKNLNFYTFNPRTRDRSQL